MSLLSIVVGKKVEGFLDPVVLFGLSCFGFSSPVLLRFPFHQYPHQRTQKMHLLLQAKQVQYKDDLNWFFVLNSDLKEV